MKSRVFVQKYMVMIATHMFNVRAKVPLSIYKSTIYPQKDKNRVLYMHSLFRDGSSKVFVRKVSVSDYFIQKDRD